ncbi:hypothetical protein F5B21DRAFT_111751 [Xylaria acuta]|nr:hypothetical protein F5B21DRAFT_111751 [Xylaria acuta]
MVPTHRMYESFLCFIFETKLQILLGLRACEVPTWESLNPARNSSLYSQYRQLIGSGTKSEPFRELLKKNAYGRRFFTTVKGRFGMTSMEDVSCVDAVYEADQGEPTSRRFKEYQNAKDYFIVACLGGRFPYIIRETHQRRPGDPTLRYFEYCGECYLWRAMDGEDFKVPDERGQRVLSSNAGLDLITDIAIV